MIASAVKLVHADFFFFFYHCFIIIYCFCLLLGFFINFFFFYIYGGLKTKKNKDVEAGEWTQM